MTHFTKYKCIIYGQNAGGQNAPAHDMQDIDTYRDNVNNSAHVVSFLE